MLTKNNHILEVVKNPFESFVKMNAKNTCFGCTHLLLEEYDTLEHRYRPYCSLFDVWQDKQFGRIKPNMVCEFNIRDKNHNKQN